MAKEKGWFEQDATEIAQRNLGKEAWKNMNNTERQIAADDVAQDRNFLREVIKNMSEN